jgi:acyl-CoA thioester hydrolase
MKRDRYPHLVPLQTRWADNDAYGHVNNVVYYEYFDTAINRYLIEVGGLDIEKDDAIGVCVESQCRYLQSIAFPDQLEAGVAVTKLGNSSVRYQIGIFKSGDSEPRAEGTFVHVFVDRAARRPTPIPQRLREALERLRISG